MNLSTSRTLSVCQSLGALVLFVAAVFGLPAQATAQESRSALDARLQPWIAQIAEWAAAPEIVDAVRAQNEKTSASLPEMTQDAWSRLARSDAVVTGFKRNPASKFLRTVRKLQVSEAFVNDASGAKVAFLEKPTNWNHSGFPKHDVPMTGATWCGRITFDESSGCKQVQIAVPVLDQGKAIGSLVVGINVYELAANP